MRNDEKRPYTNPRQMRQEHDRRLLIIVLVTLVFVGSGVVGLVYGGWAVLTAVPALLAGAALILLPYLVLQGLQKWRDKIEQDAWKEAQAEQEQSPLVMRKQPGDKAKEGANGKQ